MKAIIIRYTKEFAEFPDGFPLRVQMIPQHVAIHFHCHDFVELVIVTGGHASHLTSRDVRQIQAGDAIVILPGERHAYRNAHGLSLINILFLPLQLPLPFALLHAIPGMQAFLAADTPPDHHLQYFHFPESEMTTVLDLVAQLTDELGVDRPDARASSLALFLQLLIDCTRKQKQKIAVPDSDMHQLGKVIHFLETHYASSISLQALVQISGMSQRSFIRLFKKHFHLAPIQYLIKYRIDRATDLLGVNEMPIASVAHSVGFTDSNYFSSQFHRIKRMSPRAYRASIRRSASDSQQLHDVAYVREEEITTIMDL